MSPGGYTGPPLGDCRPAGGGRPNSAGGEKSFVKSEMEPEISINSSSSKGGEGERGRWQACGGSRKQGQSCPQRPLQVNKTT